MNDSGPITVGGYSHDLLIHDCDEQLVASTRAFVDQGLASGGQVIVHSTPGRVELLRDALGTHPRLDYGLDSDLYESPSTTLFNYQRAMAESPEPLELWATGTVPLGDDAAGHAAWSRYESLVNTVLGAYAFHGLCTYDARTLPETTLAAARATHPCLSSGEHRTASADYQDPADFLTDPLADAPHAPGSSPVVHTTLRSPTDLSGARELVTRTAVTSSAVARETIQGLVTAVNEVLVNALAHGRAPVELALWVEPSKLTCRVSDAGPGVPDRLAGYRYPAPTGPRGLWLARQSCEELLVADSPGGGCSVLLTTG